MNEVHNCHSCCRVAAVFGWLHRFGDNFNHVCHINTPNPQEGTSHTFLCCFSSGNRSLIVSTRRKAVYCLSELSLCFVAVQFDKAVIITEVTIGHYIQRGQVPKKNDNEMANIIAHEYSRLCLTVRPNSHNFNTVQRPRYAELFNYTWRKWHIVTAKAVWD